MILEKGGGWFVSGAVNMEVEGKPCHPLKAGRRLAMDNGRGRRQGLDAGRPCLSILYCLHAWSNFDRGSPVLMVTVGLHGRLTGLWFSIGRWGTLTTSAMEEVDDRGWKCGALSSSLSSRSRPASSQLMHSLMLRPRASRPLHRRHRHHFAPPCGPRLSQAKVGEAIKLLWAWLDHGDDTVPGTVRNLAVGRG